MNIRIGGPPSPPPQADPAKEPESTSSKETPTPTPTPGPAETKQTPQQNDKKAQVAEHSIAGQARAALLKSAEKSSTGGVTNIFGSAMSAMGEAAAQAAVKFAKPLSQGDQGPEVEKAQVEINNWRWANGKKPIKETGKFDEETERAVRDFQSANGLKADCIYGPNTRDRLELENDPYFKSLPADTKKKVRDQMDGYSQDPISREKLKDLATNSNFADVSQDGQNWALKTLALSPQSTANLNNVKQNVRDRAGLEKNANFEKLDVGTKKQITDSMEKHSLDKNNRDQLVRIATDPALGKLSRPLQEEALKAFEKAPGDASYVGDLKKIIGSEAFQSQKMTDALKTRTLEVAGNNAINPTFTDSLAKIVDSKSFDKMDDALKTRTLDLAANHSANNQHTRSLTNLVTHDNFGAMPAQDQGKTLNVFEGASMDGKEALAKLMKKDVNGTPALMSKSTGTTGKLIDHLDRLNSTNIAPNVADGSGTPANKRQVTEDLLKELANPNQNINQDNRGTCAPTSISYKLAVLNPAEYARIVTDLTTTGQSTLANGSTIQPPADAFMQDNSNRSVSERLLQSSLMNLAYRGTYQNWNPGADGTRGTPDDGFLAQGGGTSRFLDGAPPGTVGLSPEQETTVLNATTGKTYRNYTGEADAIPDNLDMLNKTKEQLKAGKGPVHAYVFWRTVHHGVEILKVEDGRVFFRNPVGGNIPGVANGVGPTDVGPTPPRTPPRRVEDGPNGIESMSEADFMSRVAGLQIQ